MNPKQFLQIGGVVLLVVGVLGFLGVIGPTASQSLFGPFWWFDPAENVAHSVLGLAALVAAYTFPALWQKYLVMAVGALALVVGLYNLMGEVMLLGANLESPADLVLHLAVGIWALYSVFGEKKVAASAKTEAPSE